MMSSRSKALVVATVTGIQDTSVIYPYCTVCYGKLNKDFHFNQWVCIRCQISYMSDCIPYRYCLRLNIADETLYCGISVFGETLQPYFGLVASEMQKLFDLLHSDQIMEVLKKIFVGKCFIFEFKTLLLNKENSSNLCLLSVIKKNCISLFDNNLVAYKIINNNVTNNDTVYTYLMKYNNHVSFSKKFKMNKSHSLQTNEIIDFQSSLYSTLSYYSTLQGHIVLSWETKRSECQNSRILLTALHFYKSSPSFFLGSSHCKLREFSHRKKSLSFFCQLNFDKNKNLYEEQNKIFLSSKQLQVLFSETDFRREYKMKEICLHLENISVREMYKDEIETFGNAVDLEKATSVKLNNSRQNISHIIGSEDLSKILNDFDERISENSVKTIANCKQYSIQKSRISLCSANSSLYSLEDINNFVNKFSELNNHTYSSTADNISGDLFETVSEKTSNYTEKCNASNHCQIFFKSTFNSQKENVIISLSRKSALLLCSHTSNKDFCHLLLNNSQLFSSTQSHIERKSNLSGMTLMSHLQVREKQTAFPQKKVNNWSIQNDSYQCSKSKESNKNVKKCMNKTKLISFPFQKSCTSPVPSSNRLSFKLYISKIKTNIYQETLVSTPIRDSSVSFLNFAKNSSSYDAFGTPIQRTDFIQEEIYCDSPSLLCKESPHFHGFLAKSPPKQNDISSNLFTPSNDSDMSLSLSLQFSTKEMNEFSQDLFSHESSPSPISQYFNKKNYITPVSLKSTHYLKKYHCWTKRIILQNTDDFIDSTYNKE